MSFSNGLDSWLKKTSDPSQAATVPAKPLPATAKKEPATVTGKCVEEETLKAKAPAGRKRLRIGVDNADDYSGKGGSYTAASQPLSPKEPASTQRRTTAAARGSSRDVEDQEESPSPIANKKRRVQTTTAAASSSSQASPKSPVSKKEERTPPRAVKRESDPVKKPVKAAAIVEPLKPVESRFASSDSKRRPSTSECNEATKTPPPKKRGKTSTDVGDGAHQAASSPSSARGGKKGVTKEEKRKALPLEGYKIVLTGVYESSSREEMECKVKRYGGQLTSAVSGVTDVLVIGTHLEDGKPVTSGSKYRKAIECQTGVKADGKPCKKSGIKIITETEFLSMLPSPSSEDSRDSVGIDHGSEGHQTPDTAVPQSSSLLSSHGTTGMAVVSPLGPTPPSLPATSPSKGGRQKREQLMSKETAEGLLSTAPLSGKGKDSNTQQDSSLWSERWRPRCLAELLGNGETIKKLVAWLKDWESVCIHGKLKPVPAAKGGRFSEPERINARAAMLSGPPGIGKTTTARIASEACGYEVIEFNASDDRGKNIVEVLSDMTSGGCTLTSLAHGKTPYSPAMAKKKTVLVMDEMDGLSAGDRGGAQALIKLITTTRCPVICICNDRMHTKVRSLVSKCYDLKFQKPPKNIVAKRIVEICQREGLPIEYNAAELLCESVGNDVRQILNTLQILGRSAFASTTTTKSGKDVTFDRMKKAVGFGIKDAQVMLNHFDVCKRVLTSSELRRMTLMDRFEAFFIDMDIMPLMMEENYLPAILNHIHPPTTAQQDAQTLERICDAADAFTFSDMMSARMRGSGQWGLLPDVAVFSLLEPAAKCSGFLARTEFPKWLGKYSTTTKNRRLLNELQLYLAPSTSTCPTAMRHSGYLDLLYAAALQPLLKGDGDAKENAQRTVEFLDKYGMTREHLIENVTSLRLKMQDKLYECIDSGAKRALTSTYNSTVHHIKMAPSISTAVKKGAVKLESNAEVAEAPDAETTAPIKEEVKEDEEAAEDADSSPKGDQWILPKKDKKKAAPKKKASAKAKSSPAKGARKKA